PAPDSGERSPAALDSHARNPDPQPDRRHPLPAARGRARRSRDARRPLRAATLRLEVTAGRPRRDLAPSRPRSPVCLDPPQCASAGDRLTRAKLLDLLLLETEGPEDLLRMLARTRRRP